MLPARVKRKRNRLARLAESSAGWQNEAAHWQRIAAALITKAGGQASLSKDEIDNAHKRELAVKVEGDTVYFRTAPESRIIVPRFEVN